MTAAAAPSTAVERAFRVLQVVVAADQALGVREIGRLTGLPRSTAARLITTLTDLGMVARTSDGVVAGSALATLRPGATTARLGDQLRPLLAEIVAVSGEHAAVAVDGDEAIVYLSQVSADQPVSAPDVAGQRHPFHVVAPGLLAMAWWDDQRLDTYLAAPLEAPTDHSMVDPGALRRRVAEVRAAGHVWTDQELDLGVNGLAVPVLADDETLLATISVYGPSYRFAPEHLPDLGTKLAAMAADRSAALIGHRTVPEPW